MGGEGWRSEGTVGREWWREVGLDELSSLAVPPPSSLATSPVSMACCRPCPAAPTPTASMERMRRNSGEAALGEYHIHCSQHWPTPPPPSPYLQGTGLVIPIEHTMIKPSHYKVRPFPSLSFPRDHTLLPASSQSARFVPGVEAALLHLLFLHVSFPPPPPLVVCSAPSRWGW